MEKKSNFGNKLLLQVLGTVILVFGITIFFVTKYSFETSEDDAKLYINELSSKYANSIKAEVDESIAISKMMAFKYSNALKSGHPLKEEEVISFMSDILNDNSFIVGFWFKIKGKELFFKAGDPKDSRKWYDKTGQFNPYVARAGSEITINPGSPYSLDLEWVKGPYERKGTYITKPYMYPINGVEVLMSTVAIPMYNDGEFIGSIGIDIVMDTLTKMAKEIKLYDNGYIFITDHHGFVIGHPQSDKFVGKKLLELTKNDSDYSKSLNMSKEKKDYSFLKVSRATNEESFYFSKSFNLKSGDNWTFFASVPHKEYLAHANFLKYFSIIAGLIAVILVALVIYLSVRKLNKNLVLITEGLNDFFNYLNKKSKNPKQIEIKSNDEFGIMAHSINENVENIRVGIDQDTALLDDVKNIAINVNNGYLNKRIEKSTTTDSLNELKEILNDMLNTLESLVGKDLNKISEVLSKYTQRDFTAKLDNTSGKIGHEIIEMNKMITQMLIDNQNGGLSVQQSANELTDNMNILSNNATSQAASLEETAASIDEITSNIEQTSQKAQEMLSISNNTKTSANDGKKLANDTVNAMDEINETVININESISVIDQIAFQTNILSLNAAVEAATAGEAGKGFAVVAQEVRNLASRSAEAAKEIKELVESATTRANNGKNISSKMIDGFTILEEKIVETSTLIDDVTNAAKEQSVGMNQIADAVGQLDQFTQENAAVADKTNTIANSTNKIAVSVVENISKNNFEGKNTTVSKKTTKSDIPNIQTRPIQNKSVKKVATKIEKPKVIQAETSSNDEWESF